MGNKHWCKKFLAVALLLLGLSRPIPALACTVFAATDSNQILAGNNEDWLDKDTFIWFLPAEDGKYGRVFYGFENAHPQGGLNEKGLFFDWFASGDKMAPKNPDKQDYPGDLSDGLLEKCATVEEALALYEQYNEVNFGYATILLADATGDLATITWDWQNNKPLVNHKQGGHMEIGSGAKDIKPWLDQQVSVNKEKFVDMLNIAHNDETLYSTVCDLKKLEIAVYNQHHFDASVTFDVAAELKKGPHVVSIPSLFPEQKLGTGNPLTPWVLRTLQENIIYIVFGLFFAASVVVCLLLVLIHKPKGLMRANLLTTLAANAIWFWLVSFLNQRLFFANKYGMNIYGWLAAFWPWVLAMLTFAQMLLVIAAWVKKQDLLVLRIYLSIATVMSMIGLGCLVALGLF